jgi:hypothetical protein
MHRVLSDFYPAGATPQLTTATFIVPGPAAKRSEFNPYLSAWGHMLVAGDALINMMHKHPFRTDGSQVEFEIAFPSTKDLSGVGDFQSDQVVNTVHFDVPVEMTAAPLGP